MLLLTVKKIIQILGWLLNVEEDRQQSPADVYFKLNKSYDIKSFVLYKKILIFFDKYYRKYLF